MAAAVNRVIAMGGGFAIAENGAVVAEMALPIAGLMSLEPFETVTLQLEHMLAAARRLGCSLPEPLIQVAFLALPLIPHLKMTPRGRSTSTASGSRRRTGQISSSSGSSRRVARQRVKTSLIASMTKKRAESRS